MKIQLGADELDQLEDLDDAELAALVRESLAKFRAKRGAKDNDLDDADTGGLAHTAPNAGTRETPASRAANSNTVTGDSAQKLREWGLSERRIAEILAPNTTSAADQRAAEKLIPNLGRLK